MKYTLTHLLSRTYQGHEEKFKITNVLGVNHLKKSRTHFEKSHKRAKKSGRKLNRKINEKVMKKSKKSN